MTLHSLQTTGSLLQGVPVAMIVTKQLLLTQKSSGLGTARVDSKPTQETYTVRAIKLTSILKSIPGFTHGGLND